MTYPSSPAPKTSNSHDAARASTRIRALKDAETRSVSMTSSRPHPRARDVYGWLVFRDGSKRRMPLFRGRNFAGNSAQVRLKIIDPYVSRHHFFITCGHGAALIEDCESTNGTWVNGRRVKRQLIAHEDRITVGKTQFHFFIEGFPRPAVKPGLPSEKPWFKPMPSASA